MLREKRGDGTTVLTGGNQPDIDAIYWQGFSVNPASTINGWVTLSTVPTTQESNDPNTAFTPVAGGIQFNFPGTYEVEAVAFLNSGVDAVNIGFGFYTTGSIVPGVPVSGTILGGSIIPIGASAAPYYAAKTTVVVKSAGAKVLMQYYYPSGTSRVLTVSRLMATKINQGAPGPQGKTSTIEIDATITGSPGTNASVTDVGTPGAADLIFTIPRGDQGIQGTRWGMTGTWVLSTASNVLVTFADGGPPRVGDLIVGGNGFDPGQVTQVTAVVDATHANLSTTTYVPNLRGPQGPAGYTNITLNNLSISTDLNTLTETGFYELINNNATANAPSGYTNGFLTVAGTGNNTTQTFQVIEGDRFYHRSRKAGSWTAWRELAAAVVPYGTITAIAAQSMANGTEVTMTFSTSSGVILSGGMTADSTGLTVPSPGIYLATFIASFASSASTGSRIMVPKINGSTAAGWAMPVPANGIYGFPLTRAFPLAAGDKVSYAQYQSSGGALNTHVQAYPGLTLSRIGG